MKRQYAKAIVVTLMLLLVIGSILINNRRNRRAAEARADSRARVERWVEKLDGQTTETGVYIRHSGEELPENDVWGKPLIVSYAQGGFAETVTVRSAGPDGISHSDDDIIASRSTANLKGVGTAAKKNIEDFAEKGARGTARGVIQGLKEGVKGNSATQKSDGQ